MKRILRPLLLAAVLATALTSCEQPVDIALNDAEPRIVIEGWVSDLPEAYDFKVTQSGPYLGNGADIPVSGAQLILRDDMGGVDTLTETRPGWYRASHLQGQMLHRYTLEATVGGKTYRGTDLMPRINPILGSGYEYNDTMVFGAGYYVGLLAQEPAGIGDFYQFRFWRNDTMFNKVQDLLVTDDRFVDGQLSPFLFPYPCRLGDTVIVEVRALSQASYDYYVSLFQQGAGTGGPFATVPDNLITNIDNEGLGWFGAAPARRDTLVIQ